MPSLIEPNPERDRVIWFPSQLRWLFEGQKSRWRFGSSPILRDQAMEWWSVDGSIVGGPHFAALRELECAAHGQAWTEWHWARGEGVVGGWAVFFNRPFYWAECMLDFLGFLGEFLSF